MEYVVYSDEYDNQIEIDKNNVDEESEFFLKLEKPPVFDHLTHGTYF